MKWTDLSGVDGGFGVGQFWFLYFLFVISFVSVMIIALTKKVFKKSQSDGNIPFWIIALMVIPFPFLYDLLSVGGKSFAEYLYVFLVGYYIMFSDKAIEKAEKYRYITFIDGYYYEGADGSQICLWTYFSDRVSKENVHEFDEYVLCVSGEYVEIFNDEEHILHAGDELLIPKGTPHHGRVTKGTRTIHAFGGRRINAVISRR